MRKEFIGDRPGFRKRSFYRALARGELWAKMIVATKQAMKSLIHETQKELFKTPDIGMKMTGLNTFLSSEDSLKEE